MLGALSRFDQAYKQVPIHSESLRHGVLGYKTPKTWMEDVHHLLAALRGLGFSLCFQQDKPEPVVQNGA